ncbi:spermatogenesis-associated protein 31E1-like isoform X2 [Nycticebus coucang]|uniref:spermatogenesis-associated protein 31E1-like isoform X2 n=1 Tax=Nycticebus coucang TaxID=9470 RepID=UPI00234CF41F|nr:spermatogenesis-associated protein 31E1-like isoform X2 [Nycticebus coucang]
MLFCLSFLPRNSGISLQPYITCLSKKDKHPMDKRGRPRSRKKSCALKACRDCLRELEGAWDLILLLQSLLGKLPDKGGSHQVSCGDPLGEVCTPAPASTHRRRGEPLEDASPTTLPTLASPIPPLASTLSGGPQGEQSVLKRVPLGAVPESSPPGCSFLDSPIWATLGLERTILFLSWWWAAAKALFFPTSHRGKSQKPLFHPTPEAQFWGTPKLRQMESGRPTFLHPEVLRLLEMLITKRAEVKLWTGKEGEGPLLTQTNPDSPRGSLRNMLKSLHREWDAMVPHNFWNMEDKREQLPGHQQLPHSKATGDHLQQKCSQLFWGLPSLHSESLVATAWVSRTSPSKPPLSVSFNAVQTWSEAPAQCHRAQPRPHQMALPQPQLPPPPPDEVHVQAHLPPSPPDMLYFSPPQIKVDLTGGCRTTCPSSQEKARFPPTKSEHLEWHLQTRQKWKRILPSLLQNSQIVFSQHTFQDGRASMSHKSVSTLPGAVMGPEHQNQQDQHTRRSFIQDELQSGPPWRSQASGELIQPQEEFPGRGQSQRPVFAAGESSKEVQKMGTRFSERSSRKGFKRVKEDDDSSGDLEQDLKGDPEDPCTGSRYTLVKILADDEEESERHWIRLQKYKSNNYILSSPEKQGVETNLRCHLDQKLEEISEGTIPVSVYQSWLTTSHAITNSDPCTKPRNLASWRKCHVDTSQAISFLDPCTQQILEAHVTRFQEPHRWGCNLQFLEPINLRAQHWPYPSSAFLSWDNGDLGDDSKAEVGGVLGEHHWKDQGEKVIRKNSIHTLSHVLSASSPVDEDTQKDLRGTKSLGTYGNPEAPLTAQECRWPSQPLTCSPVSSTWQSTAVLGDERGSPEPSPYPAMARHKRQEKENVASGDSCSSTAVRQLSRRSQSSRANEPREPVEAEEGKPSAWEVTLTAGLMANSQTTNMNLSSGCQGTNIFTQSRMSATQDLGELHLKTKVVSKFQFKMEVETEKQQLQGPATGVLLQDYGTGLCFRGRHTNMIPPTDILPSQPSPSNSQASPSQTSSSNFPATPPNSQATLPNSQPSPSNSQASPSNSQTPPSNSQTSSSNFPATPPNSQASPSNSQTNSSNLPATPPNSQATLPNSQASPSNSQASPSNAQSSSSNLPATLPNSQAPLLSSQASLLSSQVPLSSSQSVFNRDTSASQGLCDPTWKGGSSQGQQVPRSLKINASWKSHSKMFGPTDKKEPCGRPKAGEQKPRSAVPRASQASGPSHAAHVREKEETWSKHFQFLLEKGRKPLESCSRKTISHGLWCLDPSEKGRRQEDPLQKGKPKSATAQSWGTATGGLSSSAPEVQAIVSLVTQILVDKLGLCQGHGPSEFNNYKEELQAPVGGHSCHPWGPSQPEQRRVLREKAYSHHATPMGHSHSVENRMKWRLEEMKSMRHSTHPTKIKPPAGVEEGPRNLGETCGSHERAFLGDSLKVGGRGHSQVVPLEHGGVLGTII